MSKEKTPNLNMHKFAGSDEVDYEEVNENFKIIDEVIPKYSELPGEVGVIDKSIDFVNVKRFGAKGDGIADDTVAIQNAIKSSRNVYFPIGVYKITKTLVLNEYGQKLVGDSSRETTIRQHTNNIPIIIIKTAHFRVEHLELQFATQQTGAMTRGNGIELGDPTEIDEKAGAYEGALNQLHIHRTFRGVYVPDWADGAFAFENTIEHVRVFDAWDTSFHVAGTGNIGLTTNTFINCYSLHQKVAIGKGAGYYIGNHDDFVMINCAVDHSRDRALMVNWSSGTIIDFHAEECHVHLDWHQMIFINESKVVFSNLQVIAPYMYSKNECYLLHISGERSRVLINNYRERNVTLVDGAIAFSIVGDGLGEVVIDYAIYERPAIISGKYSINAEHWRHNAIPTKGKWRKGDIVWNANAEKNSSAGWICTQEGDFSVEGNHPLFTPIGVVGNTYSQSEFGHIITQSARVFGSMQADSASANYGWFSYLEVPNDIIHTAEVPYGSEVSQTYILGASNEDSVDPNKFYKFALKVGGNAQGRYLYIYGHQRGQTTPIPVQVYGETFIDSTNLLQRNFALNNGPTASRPSNPLPVAGSVFYDTTLGKPIFFNGTVWKDAMGTTV